MISSLLKSIFGDKSAQDFKKYQPIIEQTKHFSSELLGISDDQLRAKTYEFKEKIKKSTSELENQMADIKSKADHPETPIFDKDDLYNRIDEITKEIDDKLEEVLLEIMPEAFAVVKETARRWNENGQLVVTATEFDKLLAKEKDGITFEGEKAIWHNEWTAAGTKVKWNMVHYDVQLMGGAVLHKGNIAEMQTGEDRKSTRLNSSH